MANEVRVELAEGVNFQSFGEGEDGILLSMESGYLYRCNDSAVVLLDALQSRPTLSDLQHLFTETFGVELAQANSDIAALLDELLVEGLIATSAA